MNASSAARIDREPNVQSMHANADWTVPTFTYSATVGHLVSAIAKLSSVNKVEAGEEELLLYRGVSGQLPASFFEALVKSGGRDYVLESSWKEALATWVSDAGNNAGANGPCRNAELHLYFGIGNEVLTDSIMEAFFQVSICLFP